jgi:hypothetical protein
MIKKILVLIVFLQSVIISQNLDSLYTKLLELKPKENTKGLTVQSIKNRPIKCGFGIAAEIKQHFNEYSFEQQQTITEILSRPSLQTSIVSPSGFFRIHFDTTGRNIPSYISEEDVYYNVSQLAEAFDSSYNFEINILGYPPPPQDYMNGGDNKFDIYVENMGGGNYALTTTDSSLGDGKYTSYIQIDNSFSQNEGYYTYGIEAAKATAAHEFHHTIQMGNYLLNLEDRYYYELTSSAMEEAVFDEVNDYYFSMPSFFNYTERSFIKHDGYDLAIWNIYLREKFGGKAPNQGDKIIKRSWELMAKPNDNRAIVAVAKALSEFGYSFKEVFREFSIWIYFTNNHTKKNAYFEEAENYPPLKINYKYNFTAPQQILTIKKIEPISIRYIRFLDDSQGLPDTIISIISDSDAIKAATNPDNYNQVEYTLANSSFEGANKINDYYYDKMDGISLQNISGANIVNNELAEKNIKREEIEYAYPQPYTYDSNSLIFIPTSSDISGEAELNIYSSDMNLIYSNTHRIILSDKISVSWNALDNNGNRLTSGVYIYVTKANDEVKKGKIVIFNK